MSDQPSTAAFDVLGPVTPGDDGSFAAMFDGAVFPVPFDPTDDRTAGESTCPVCGRTWTVTVYADCFMPACGCYGDDATAANPNRPCESCGLSHAWKCEKPND